MNERAQLARRARRARRADRAPARRAPVCVALIAILYITGCSLVTAPGSIGERAGDPARELFVVHSLAETLSAVELAGDGSFVSAQDDVSYLGAIPNDATRVEESILVTLSGQNELLLLEESSLAEQQRITLPAGSNPMQSVNLGSYSDGTAAPGDGVVATTNLLSASVRFHDLESRTWRDAPPWEAPVGRAPQALSALPGSSADEMRLAIANTAYSAERPSDRPYGAATLTVLTLAIDTEAESPSFEVVGSSTVDLEAAGFDPETESGLNPTAIVDLPDAGTNGEVAVVGSGVNYGTGGSGNDDGTVVVLDRATLSEVARVAVGGSPGSAVAHESGSDLQLFLAGPQRYSVAPPERLRLERRVDGAVRGPQRIRRAPFYQRHRNHGRYALRRRLRQQQHPRLPGRGRRITRESGLQAGFSGPDCPAPAHGVRRTSWASLCRLSRVGLSSPSLRR